MNGNDKTVDAFESKKICVLSSSHTSCISVYTCVYIYIYFASQSAKWFDDKIKTRLKIARSGKKTKGPICLASISISFCSNFFFACFQEPCQTERS